MLDKGEAGKKIKEILKAGIPKTAVELIKETGFIKQTVYKCLKGLEKNHEIKKTHDKYFIVMKEEEVNPVEFKQIRDNLKSKKLEIKKHAIDDLIHILSVENKKITQVDDLKFLINLIKNPEYREKKESLMYCLKRTVIHITEDDNTELINVFKGEIGEESEMEKFRDMLLDNSEDLEIRKLARDILVLMDDEERLEIAFTILEEEKNDDVCYKLSGNIIHNFASIDKFTVRGRLYKLAESKNEVVSKRALNFIDQIRSIGISPTIHLIG